MKFEFSAGGIVFRRDHGQIHILIAKHSGHHGWVFPKGHIEREKKETKEQAAIREVFEETGIQGEIIKPIEPITYWFVQEKEKIKKTVYYFLMQYLSGDTAQHDFEMEEVAWIPITDVMNRLTYQSDKKAWQEGEKSLVKA